MLLSFLMMKNSIFQQQKVYSTGASDKSFYPIFNKKFDHLEALLTTHRPKKVLSAESLCVSLVPRPQSKCPKRTFILLEKYLTSVSNMLSQALKCFIENENQHGFQGPSLGQTPCKVLGQGLYLTTQVSCPKFLSKIVAYFS